ncbi:bacteriophage holin [Amycolatopsis sp. 195334CR]|nr:MULTISPECIES: bacteriophage holin [unclassified Amycolatopsis]MBN6039434.1 bacteriophage holin [Amycolatopsis sp. 195334CR]
MSYMLSIVLVVIGLVLLAAVAIRLRRGLRTLRRTTSMVTTAAGDRAGLLRARSAALGVAFAQRRGPRKIHTIER